MVLKEAYQKAVELLKADHIKNSALEARLILSYILKLEHKDFILELESKAVNAFQWFTALHKIKKRLSGLSISYIIHKKYFYNSEFYITKSVLVPRPETELLIDLILERVKSGAFYDILDIGTGSGNISVEVAKKLENIKIDALDKSYFSLRVAKKNIKFNKIKKDKIKLSKKNFLKYKFKKKYDIIVSNPPYIESEEVTEIYLKKEASDPRRTLDGGVDGLKFYYKLKELALNNLNENGFMVFEHGYNQKEKILSIFKESFFSINCFCDMNKLDRAIIVSIKG